MNVQNCKYLIKQAIESKRNIYEISKFFKNKVFEKIDKLEYPCWRFLKTFSQSTFF